MTFKTIMDYFLNSKNDISPEKLNSRKKPNGVLITDQPANMDEHVEAFLNNFKMPKKKIMATAAPSSSSKPKVASRQIAVSIPQTTTDADADKKMETEEPVPKSEVVRIYTDGSCILNGKPNARGGWAVYFPGGEFGNMAEKYTRHPTNQRCELTAIQKALETTQQHIAGGGKVEIYTDSEYSLKCLQEYCKKWSINGWLKADKNPIENRDIIEPLYKFYCAYWRQINLKHVRAHTGRQDVHSKCNEIVDQMARSTIS